MIEGQARAEAKARQGTHTDLIEHSAQLGGKLKQAEFTRESRQQIAEAVGMVAMLGQARANSWWPNGHNLSNAKSGVSWPGRWRCDWSDDY